MIIEFTIPGRLPALNDFLKDTKCHNGRFFKGNDTKRKHQKDISLCIPRQAKNLCITSPCVVSFDFYEPNLKRDPDNISSVAHKFVLDALKDNQVIKDDSYRYIKEINDTYNLDRDNPRIEVSIQWEEKQ